MPVWKRMPLSKETFTASRPFLSFTVSTVALLTCCAAVLGGVNAATGRGSLVGTIIGAFVLQLLSDLLTFVGLSSYWTSLIQGALLIVVVGVTSVINIIRKKRSLEV